jgi:internalin A
MGKGPLLQRASRVAIVGALLLVGCGQTRSDAPALNGAGGVAANSGGDTGATAPGGVTGVAGNPTSNVDFGPCVFEDPNVQVLVGYQILQADELDGKIDGSAGIEAVKTLTVSQPVGALGGIECLKNLEELHLSVYELDASPVALKPLAGLSKLRRLSLYGPFVLDGAFGGFALEKLDLTYVDLPTFDEIAKERGLVELWLDKVTLTSLAGVERLQKLAKLSIEEAPLNNLLPLADIAGLEQLHLATLPSLTSLTGLETHIGLRQLHTDKVPITSLEPLANATQLESLNVWTSSLTSLAGLAGKPALNSVTVTDAQVSDITPLSGLPLLDYVVLSGNSIESLDALVDCPAISLLNVSKNRVDSLAPVATMANLKYLEVRDNLLSEVDVDLPGSVISLDLSGNAITSLQPLADHSLTSLAISSTRPTSLAPLAHLPALLHLQADDIGATDLSFFPLAQLRSLSLSHNHITDIAPLSHLGALSVSLSGNDVVSIPPDFVGPAVECGGLILLDNPLDDDAQARLAWLCDQKSAAYSWDGGSCAFCVLT